MKTSSRAKVLMLSIGYGRFGGTELGAERLRNWLVDNGFDVVVVASGKSKDIIRVPTFGVWRIFWPFFAYIISLTHVLTKGADIIYARYATYPLFLGAVLSFICNRPLVVSIHGGDIRHGWPFKILINWFLRRADIIVCYDNPGHIEELKKRGFDPVIIPNGVETRLFKPRKIRTSIAKVIYVGGTREIKGFNDAVSLSCNDRFDGVNNLEFHIYGDGSIHSDSLTKFHPKIPHDKMVDALETGQLFILPSYAEGVPGAMLEAMSSGMYVIASDLDFTRKVIDKRFLFNPGDTGRMAELVDAFRTNKKEYFGDQNKKNREVVVNSYSIDLAGEKWKELFKSLLKKD